MTFTTAKSGETWVTYYPGHGYQLFYVHVVQSVVIGFTNQKVFGYFVDCQPSGVIETCLVEVCPEGYTIEAPRLVYRLEEL